jgi:hypothetical protein
MVVQSGMLIMATQQSHILRVSTSRDLEDIPDLEKKGASVRGVYQDPTGSHVLISLESGENYYLHESWRKPKAILKMKGIIATSVVKKMHIAPCFFWFHND